MYQYDACITEGIHFILGQYDEGITMDKIRRYALAPDANNSTAWKFTPIFDMDDPQGFWQSVILVEIQQQRQRQDISTLVADRGKGTHEKKRRAEGRVGGSEEKTKGQYPAGSNLTSLERKIGYAHKPLGKNGAILCFNHSAHSGCLKGDRCGFSHVQRIKPEGLHWTVQYDLARRGGLVSQKRIEAG